jgi:TonB-linked SusC/RagA family outer membrane protein
MKRKFINLSIPFTEKSKNILPLVLCMFLILFIGVSNTSATLNSNGSTNLSLKEEASLNKSENLSLTVKGKVTSEAGEPLPGASILIKGTTIGTITDINGNFTLEVPTGDETIVVNFIGYKSEEISLIGKTELTVVLLPNLSKLEEVVVVGYGTQKKSVVTGAIAKVSADELGKSKDLRIEQTLQGKTAGVMIMNNSGQPGDNMTIQIRGAGTNNNPDPLFIVDGMPLTKHDLDYLNSSDIESVEVLKDASSAAIYGTRGGNGVVMITTKQGKKGQKFKVTYDGSYAVQNPWRKLDLLNSNEYMTIMNEASVNDGKKPYSLFSKATMDTLKWDTDWQDEMFNYNAPKISHTFSLSAGNEKSTYSSSLSYFSQDGILAKGKSDFKRLTYRLNTTHDFGRLTIGSNLNYINIKKKGIDGNNQFGTGIVQAVNMPPIVPVMYDNGEYAVPNDFNISLQEITNPVAMWNYSNKKQETNKALGNVSADFKIFEGLVFRTNFGAEYAFVIDDEYVPVYFIDATHKNDSLDYVTKKIQKYVKWNFDNTLTYRKAFGKHNATVMIGTTRFREWDQDMYALKKDIIFDDFDYAYFDNAKNDLNDQITGGYRDHRLKSYFGRLNYDYAEKYLLEGSLRIDGSTRFGPDNRYAKFPAFSAGWVVSRENFYKENNIVPFIKIRASWGKNGSENIPDFQYVALMKKGINYYFGADKNQISGIVPSFIPNTALMWEASQQLDIGTDLSLVSNKITVAFDFYNKITKNWLIQAPSLLMTGSEGITWVNGGEVQNRGYELELNYKNNLTKDLFLNIGITASTNKSTVKDIPNAEHVLQGGNGVHGQNNLLRAEVGSSLGYFWGYKTNGIVQNDEDLEKYKGQQPGLKKGDLIFVDVNGNGKINETDRTEIGSPYPKFTGGVSISLNWKIIDLNMFWYTALGHQIYMANRRDDLKYSNFTTEVLNRWHADSIPADYPRVTISDPNGNWKKVSDFYIQDADFLRLKTLTIGLSLPKKWTDFLKVGKVRAYFMGENLLTFTKYPGIEVEVGGTPFGSDGRPIGVDYGVYPVSKTYTAGINIEF